MSDSSLYPSSPGDVPEDLTRATASYKRQAWLAMAGLTVFMLFYLALAACFGWIAYSNIVKIQTGDSDLFVLLFAGIASLLSLFMIKSLFSVRKSDRIDGIEVTAQEEPKLFDFLHTLADEIGAPRPHRVFITPDVNAAVFYDLSLINMIFPSKKNLIIGLGLVNVLNLGELKAVLAHEFGHFAQGSMMVGRWVYIAQQIIAHMVSTRDWLDSVVRFISRIDLRIAWVGWILGLVIWSIRSLMDTLFRLVIIAERALSREMEFNADLVAVSVTGSDALVNALHKLQSADNAWQTTLGVASVEAGKGKFISDLFTAQKKAVSVIGEVLNDASYGVVPQPDGDDVSQHRVFSEDMARPPQMWSTHPANRDREDNAKHIYIAANIDRRSSWQVFSDPDGLRQRVSLNFYNADKIAEMEPVAAEDAVTDRFSKYSFASKYRGTYLSRSPVRHFSSIDEMMQSADLKGSAAESIASLYPESLAQQLELARSLDLESYTLKGLASGQLKPSGGVIRHRGNELKKNDIPVALQQVHAERAAVAEHLKVHDARCRTAHLQGARECGQGWENYLQSLIRLLHCSEHLHASIENEIALLVNTWEVITADGKVGHFEKRRMLKVCNAVQDEMRRISDVAAKIVLPEPIVEATGFENWSERFPEFDIADVNKKNWVEWCEAASTLMNNLLYTFSEIKSATLEELVASEDKIAQHLLQNKALEVAPHAGSCPAEYPVLLPGDEHELQQKLDLWNRFQLAHGLVPSTLRFVIAFSIVAGTLYSGVVGL
ncbi:M48 family metallopeptidase [Amphritea pacifica]|uniref:M48 family metalloprotease n=1 Tax=Amphritea pacifica TaxID=2811233 RepID=A0ABS2W922_9GAMM|nr:M48 family metallopeptidase [Amphritea pacifica]MBN0988205.1 M48 family metalloprotease [Amphritea pacifica]